MVTNHCLESDIGVKEKGCGCYYVSCAKIFCAIFSQLCAAMISLLCSKFSVPYAMCRVLCPV